MTRDVVPVDIGNSRIKFGLCDDADVVSEAASLPAGDPAAWDEQLRVWRLTRVGRWLVASVHPERLRQFRAWAESRGEVVVTIDHHSQVPVKVAVGEPERVGIDRLLNAAAFNEALPRGTPGVIIDVGTAATIDLLDEHHVFVGGAILPGPRLMFESLHRQTAKLPLIDLHSVPGGDPPGANTRDAMAVGVSAAVTGAADLLVREYAARSANPPWVVMTGGALGTLADYHFDGIDNTRTDPHLTLQGILVAAGGEF